MEECHLENLNKAERKSLRKVVLDKLGDESFDGRQDLAKAWIDHGTKGNIGNYVARNIRGTKRSKITKKAENIVKESGPNRQMNMWKNDQIKPLCIVHLTILYLLMIDV